MPPLGGVNSHRSRPLFPSLQPGPVQFAFGPFERSSTLLIEKQWVSVAPVDTERPFGLELTDPLAPVTMSRTGAWPAPQSGRGVIPLSFAPVSATLASLDAS